MEYVILKDTLQLKIEDRRDEEFLSDTFGERTEEQALSDLCDGHTSWLGNQGPAPANIPALSQAPQLAMGLDYSEDGVPRWRGLYAFLPYESKDWRTELLKRGDVIFTKVG